MAPREPGESCRASRRTQISRNRSPPASSGAPEDPLKAKTRTVEEMHMALSQRTARLSALAVVVTAVTAGTATASSAGTPPVLTTAGVVLNAATVSNTALVDVTAPGALSAKFILDGTYLGTDVTSPLQWPLAMSTGSHTLKVRLAMPDGTQARAEATFTSAAGSTQPPPVTPPPVTPPPVTPPPPAPVGTVNTVDALRAAVASAKPGSVIDVADGTYVLRPRLVASASGTASAPIVLRGSRNAILSSTGTGGDYGLQITGSYWRVTGLAVAHASKGIVLDRSIGTVLDSVEVYDIGAEGVHFRSCSSDGVLSNSFVHDTGKDKPQYGEGVYVGSANSNWSQYNCTDGRDNSERVLVQGNVFRNVPAEGADLKEGTDSGTLRGNVFDNTGFSGANSADSAVDAKGNNWLIEGNTVMGATGAFADAFQSHSVYNGYGTHNTFRQNTVTGTVPGYGFGLYPTAGNIVECNNIASGAAKGLSSAPCT